MLVSVVIPNHNGGKFILECINSVLNQTHKDIEIVVVDDDSTDDSLSVISHFSDAIKVLNSNSRGASHARNLGISQARGQFIALLDSDDLWEPTKIQKQMALITTENLGLVYCHGIEFGVSNQQNRLHKAQYHGDCYKEFELNPGRSIIELGCSTALIRKELFYEAGLFDTSFQGAAEDWDLFRRICRITHVGYIDEALIMYRRHPESVSMRDLTDFIFGNELALRKLIFEDDSITRFRSRVCWARLQVMIFKSAVRQFRLLLALRSFLKIFLGPNFRDYFSAK